MYRRILLFAISISLSLGDHARHSTGKSTSLVSIYVGDVNDCAPATAIANEQFSIDNRTKSKIELHLPVSDQRSSKCLLAKGVCIDIGVDATDTTTIKLHLVPARDKNAGGNDCHDKKEDPDPPILFEDDEDVSTAGGDGAVVAKPMLFHRRTAMNMRISKDGKTAHRRNNRAFGNTAALTTRPLDPGETFEVWVDSWDKIEHPRIGVTTNTPDDIQYPDYMNHLRQGRTYGWDVWPDQIYVDGEVTKEPYTEGERNIQRQDRYGVSVSESGSLHFHYNGRDLGSAAEGLVGEFYGYVDLYWQGSNATIVD